MSNCPSDCINLWYVSELRNRGWVITARTIPPCAHCVRFPPINIPQDFYTSQIKPINNGWCECEKCYIVSICNKCGKPLKPQKVELIKAMENEVIAEIVKALPEIPQMDATHHFSEPFINGCEQYRNLVIKALGVKEKRE